MTDDKNKICFLIPDDMVAVISNILDATPRSQFPTSSDLYRQAMEIGLAKIYKKTVKLAEEEK